MASSESIDELVRIGDVLQFEVCQRCVRSLSRDSQVMIEPRTTPGVRTVRVRCDRRRGACQHCRDSNTECRAIPPNCRGMTQQLIIAALDNFTVRHKFSRDAIKAMARCIDKKCTASNSENEVGPEIRALGSVIAQGVEAIKTATEFGIKLPPWSGGPQECFPGTVGISDSGCAFTAIDDGGRRRLKVYKRMSDGELDFDQRLSYADAALVLWTPSRKRKARASSEPCGHRSSPEECGTTGNEGDNDEDKTTSNEDDNKTQGHPKGKRKCPIKRPRLVPGTSNRSGVRIEARVWTDSEGE
ncbi:hypothetical protein AYL99_11991 [Fonsecaea erecta]|uniref:Zn(2)-C6 fungal-type domain-containing protein n=1 Tax=Fonsecaea erecta TaxID=1367422 RepID=A0A178Z3X8_9EURO|nr:hypothetical protein AYL99_11991 [Fonsecaea erecta]OAP53805.1 hypothetical protein AYL99_11991 [Fonsecaea erecta]